MHQLVSVIEMSSILCLVTLAAVLTFRLAGFPDLSVDGVFTLGAVVFAKCVISGASTEGALVVAALAGGICGCVTASTSERLKISPLLASVLLLTILCTVNLRLLGRPNQPLLQLVGESCLGLGGVSTLVLLSTAIVLTAYLFFHTELGSALRSTGTSPHFLLSVGKSVRTYRTCLVAAAGALVALSGALLASYYHFADVSMGFGVVIIGISSLVIGEKLCGRGSFGQQLLAVPVGIVVYQLVAGIALSVGISGADVKLATGVITIGLLAFRGRGSEGLLAYG